MVSEKHKADLSMESYANPCSKAAGAAQCGVGGEARETPMICRVLLPLDDEDHMPPQGKPQPTLAEIAALQLVD